MRITRRFLPACGLALALSLGACSSDDGVETAGGEADSTAETSAPAEQGDQLSEDQILEHARALASDSGDDEPDAIEWVRVDSRTRAMELISGSPVEGEEEDGSVVVVGMRGDFDDAAAMPGAPLPETEGEAAPTETMSRAAVYFTIDEEQDLVLDVVATDDVVDLSELGEVTQGA